MGGPRRGRGAGWCGIQSARTMEPNWGPGDEGGIIAGVLYTLYPRKVFASAESDAELDLVEEGGISSKDILLDG